MIIVKNIAGVKKHILRAKKNGDVIGFVPTMGALHQGHLALVDAAKKDTDFVVVSIFINPLQFGPREDYTDYPRTLAADMAKLKNSKVDLVFAPQPEELYLKGFSTYVYETARSSGLCAKSRPGLFKGVCTIITKLFNIVAPDSAYFGQKDYQQALIIKKLVKDLNFPVRIMIVPTVREPNGLAMSSRNNYLDAGMRHTASILYKALRKGESAIKNGERDPRKVISLIQRIISSQKEIKVDYIEVRDAQNLSRVTLIKTDVVIAIAAYIGRVRLIDNIICRD